MSEYNFFSSVISVLWNCIIIDLIAGARVEHEIKVHCAHCLTLEREAGKPSAPNLLLNNLGSLAPRHVQQKSSIVVHKEYYGILRMLTYKNKNSNLLWNFFIHSVTLIFQNVHGSSDGQP